MAEQPTAPGVAESAAESPPRRRLPPDERRSEIFNAALKVFSELGYDRATLNDVVERVGVSKGCLYHHFESKERLLMELLREKVSMLQAEEEILSAAVGSREEVVRAMVDRMWRHLEEPGRIEFTKLLITELPKVPGAALIFVPPLEPRNRRRCAHRQQLRSRALQLAAGSVDRASS